MNRERAKELLPIVRAFAEGKTIQCRNLDSDVPYIREWRSIGDVKFMDDFEYRIKPEPMEIWVNVDPHLGLSAYESYQKAKLRLTNHGQIKRFREVTE